MDEEAQLRVLDHLDVGDPPPIDELVARVRHRRVRRRTSQTFAVVATVVVLLGVAVTVRTRSSDVVAIVPATPDTTAPSLPSANASIPGTAEDPSVGQPRVLGETPIGRFPYDSTFGAGSVWVLDHIDQTVTRIDPGDGHVQATIKLPGPPVNPNRIAVGTNAAWVAGVDGSRPEIGAVARIDLATNAVTTIDTAVRPISVAVAGNDVWVAGITSPFDGGGLGQAGLQHLDAATGRLGSKIDLPFIVPVDVAVTGSGVWVLSQDRFASQLEHVDRVTGASLGHVDLPPFAVRLVVAGDFMVVGSDTSGGGGRSGRIDLVDPVSYTVTGGTEIPARPEGIVVTDQAIVTTGLHAFDRRTLAPIEVGPSLDGLGGFTLTAGEGTLWASKTVASTGSSVLVRIAPGSLK